MELQPGPLGSMVVHRVPAPMDPSRELQPGPLGSMVVHHAGPAFADVHPMFADVCIRSPNVCRRLHTFTQCLPTSAYFWPWDPWLCILPARSALITRWNSKPARPWDPWLCIMLAHGSMVVHTSGPGIHGCASSFGPAFADVCIRSTNVCRRLHTSGPVGVDHSMELQPGPLGSIEGTASSPGPQGIASCWPGRR